MDFSGTRTAFYGAPAVVALLFFASGIPRVQNDILQVHISRTYDSIDMIY